MKNLLWSLLGIMLFFTACSNEEENGLPVSSGTKAEVVNHYYGVKSSKANLTKGVAQTSNLWHPNANIRIKFLNGTQAQQDLVKQYANEWQQHIGLNLDFVEDGQAEVRLAFDWYDESRFVTWSYTGTDCKVITDQSTPTANFAFFDYLEEFEQKGDVLRVFGQILGLELEHRHLDFDPRWRNNVQSYWEGNIEDIPWEVLEQYVFTPLSESQVVQTDEFDAESIMIWAFPRNVTLNSDLWNSNYELSATDIEFIKQLYPKNEEEDDAIVTMKFKVDELNNGISFLFLKERSFIVDWGDGNISESGDLTNNRKHYMYAHKYAPLYYGTEINIKIYGQSSDLTYLYIYTSSTELKILTPSITELNIDKCSNIEELAIWGGGLQKPLDLSHNPQLNVLRIFDNNSPSISLDLSNNPKLRKLEIENKPKLNTNGSVSVNLNNNNLLDTLYFGHCTLNSLDLSNNSHLSYLSINELNALSDVDLSKQVRLKKLSMTLTPIERLNVFDCQNLEQLSCYGTRISSLDLSNNKRLKSVDCSKNMLHSLILPGEGSELERVDLLEVNLNSIDLSKSEKLKNITFYQTPISSLDISMCRDLEYLTCFNGNLGALDCSNNPYLKYVHIADNPIVTNQNALTITANTLLPQNIATIRVANETAKSWIRDIVEPKGWIVE